MGEPPVMAHFGEAQYSEFESAGGDDGGFHPRFPHPGLKRSRGIRLPSPVPKGEGPGAPSFLVETVTETGATRHSHENDLYG